ncbi:hypothetical protein LG52_3492 [Geobacillus kaustophilus]|uniref:Uncharacterized protein n=1 Tax=Geobacillus kaustophilus TaxID=1462 RepID=A0A0D8BR30_GEOKU|nr:hypothetical protein LG52_3492 [Geobacillus kaustophilus]
MNMSVHHHKTVCQEEIEGVQSVGVSSIGRPFLINKTLTTLHSPPFDYEMQPSFRHIRFFFPIEAASAP